MMPVAALLTADLEGGGTQPLLVSRLIRNGARKGS
jgi:hypothetical protein